MALLQISGPMVLEIPTDPACLFLVRAMVRRLAERMELPENDIHRMVLAVDEACTNVVRHAYGNRYDQRMILSFMVQEDRLEITLRDFGAGADPRTFQPRDLSELRPGGLGMHFIRSTMDEVHYESPEDGGTLLRMIKLRSSGGGPDGIKYST